MKKRLLLFYFALCTIFGVSAVDFEVDGILYNELSPTTVEVTYGDKKYTGDVNIPSCVTYNERKYTVTSIGRSAFRSCEDLKSVGIPNSVISIGDFAFSQSPNLSTFYGKFASADNRCLIVDGELKAFAPSGLTEYSIPQSATSIGEGTFIGCDGLTSVTIPNSVASIGNGAFSYCLGLTSATIPYSVDSIGNSVFFNCPGILTFYGKFASADNRCLIVDGEIKAFAPSGLTEYSIPQSATSIGYEAFAKCSDLTSVIIPKSVTYIGESAFMSCNSLTSVNIPNSVISIGDYAFSDCKGLISASISNSVDTLGRAIFASCPALRTFHGKFASEDNRCLIVDGELKAFAPSGLTEYSIPESVTSIGSQAFSGYQELAKVIIPNSVTSIGKYAFDSCEGLTSATIPNSVTSIGNYAFYNCKGLTSATIPNLVTSIGSFAFYNCESLTSVRIPASMTFIGGFAFGNCKGLTSVACLVKNPSQITMRAYVFDYDIFTKCTLYVPEGSEDMYKTADQWKDFTHIVGI